MHRYTCSDIWGGDPAIKVNCQGEIETKEVGETELETANNSPETDEGSICSTPNRE